MRFHPPSYTTISSVQDLVTDEIIDTQRRRIPLRKDALLLPSPSYQANSLAFAVFDHNWQQQEQSTLQHPLSQQSPQQTFQFHANPSYNHNDQQIQLNTPPLDSPSGFELPSQRNNHIDDDMVIDDDCQGAFDTTSHHFPQHHSHTAPPSPISPGLVADNGHDDNIDPIKWEGTKNKGYPRDAYEDPNANLWTGGRSHRKNMDGHVKGFKMGYLEGCEKCRVRARGHFGHFIMADSI